MLETPHSLAKLASHIIELSESSKFSTAKLEWDLTGIELLEDWDNCPCGKEIKELCFIENRINGNQTYVGNVCINRFVGIDTGTLFEGLKRIVKDNSANPNVELIIHAFTQGYIYDSEYLFLMNTKLKRKLSAKQLAWKIKINQRIINKTVVGPKRPDPLQYLSQHILKR